MFCVCGAQNTAQVELERAEELEMAADIALAKSEEIMERLEALEE